MCAAECAADINLKKIKIMMIMIQNTVNRGIFGHVGVTLATCEKRDFVDSHSDAFSMHFDKRIKNACVYPSHGKRMWHIWPCSFEKKIKTIDAVCAALGTVILEHVVFNDSSVTIYFGMRNQDVHMPAIWNTCI